MSRHESDLARLADVRAWLEFKSTNVEHDAALQRLITACSLSMQKLMERDIYMRTYRYSTAGNGATALSVRHYPIHRVSSVIVDGQVVPASNISFEGRVIYLDGAYRFNKGRNNVALVYTAGFDTIPVDLAQACIETVGLRWRERDRIGHSSKTLAGETVAFTIVDFPAQVKTLMNSYKSKVPV